MGRFQRYNKTLKDNYVGGGQFEVIAKWMNRLARILNNIVCFNGIEAQIVRDQLQIRFNPNGVDLAFSGTVYLAGKRFDGLTDASKPWVKVDVANNTVTEESAPPPDPFPPAIEYYQKSRTFGDIHISRF